MLKQLDIAELGNPILRKTAARVTAIDEEITQLIDNMIYTVKSVDGVGLAAPQVFESKRAFVMASNPNPRYPDAPVMEPAAIINPVINSKSDEQIIGWEGCLSIPGIRGLVLRSISIDVEYQTLQGEKISATYHDFIARIFQHEYDHLEGIMFLDRIKSNNDLVTESEYQKIIRSV